MASESEGAGEGRVDGSNNNAGGRESFSFEASSGELTRHHDMSGYTHSQIAEPGVISSRALRLISFRVL